MRARGFANQAAWVAGVQTVDGWPWARKYSFPAADTETTTPRSGARWRMMKPRSFASSHTGSRGHEVRHAWHVGVRAGARAHPLKEIKDPMGDGLAATGASVAPLRLRGNEGAVVEHQFAGAGELARGDRVE